MPKSCTVCGHRSDRCFLSFHRFPTNESIRNKWIKALNLTKVTNFKCTYVCSEHFDETAYVTAGDLRRRKRLFKDAVPFIRRVSEQLDLSIKKELFDESTIFNNNSDITSSNLNISSIQSNLCIENNLTNETTAINNSAEEICDYVDESKYLFTDELKNKRIQFTNGFETEHLCREDFTSDTHWAQFLRFAASQKLKMSVIQKKYLNSINKIHKIKKLITNLRKQEEVEIVRCLKGLPAQVELLLRMKEFKPTVPSLDKFKNSAENIDLNSRTNNGTITQNLQHGFSSTEALDRWIYRKQYKPEISNAIINNISKIVKKESENGRHLVFNITFDEDSIVQHKEWDTETDASKDSMNVVDHKSLVLILININAGFDAPVSYYLINSLHFIPLDITLPVNEQNIKCEDNIEESNLDHSKEELMEAVNDASFEHNYFKTEGWSCINYANEIIKRSAGIVVRIL